MNSQRHRFRQKIVKTSLLFRNLMLLTLRKALINIAFSAQSGAAQRFFSLRSGESKEGSANPASLLSGRRRGRCTGAAGRAFRVLADADRMKAGAQRIVEQQGAVEAVAECQKLLQHLDRLQGAEDAGDGAEDAGGLAARHEVGRRRLAKEATVTGVAGAEIGPEGRDLAFERRQGGCDQWLFQAEAEFGQEIPRGEI